MSAEHPKKSLGQHWLHDEVVLESIARCAEVVPGDTVLEIGPGLGTLTTELLHTGARVVALEYDTKLAEHLADRLGAESRLEVVEGDIRRYDFTGLVRDYKIVANIPYYLTSYLLRALADTPNKPLQSAILMQKEVAERIASGSSNQSLVSVIVQYHFDCTLGPVVGREFFTPPPKVDSQVLVMKRRNEPRFDADTKVFYQLLKAGFSEKRKNLRNALSGGLGIDKPRAEFLLNTADIASSRRAESLNWEEWHRLYSAFTSR